MSVFPEVDRFVRTHRPCGELTGNAHEVTSTGYQVWIACCCGAVIDRWVTPENAKQDFLRAGLLAIPNCTKVL